MKDREYRTAVRFGVLEKLIDIEKELLGVEYIKEVEFDIDGFYDNINYVIVVFKYDVPLHGKDYFNKRHEMLRQMLEIMRQHGCVRTNDAIEDYGEHYYVVTECDWFGGK